MRHPGSGDCPFVPMTSPKEICVRSGRYSVSQRAVAIRALGWRLRVGATADPSLRIHDKAGHTADLLGQSPLPGGEGEHCAAHAYVLVSGDGTSPPLRRSKIFIGRSARAVQALTAKFLPALRATPTLKPDKGSAYLEAHA
jgi:hypothetical protein